MELIKSVVDGKYYLNKVNWRKKKSCNILKARGGYLRMGKSGVIKCPDELKDKWFRLEVKLVTLV